jgi:hypothetical protein
MMPAQQHAAGTVARHVPKLHRDTGTGTNVLFVFAVMRACEGCRRRKIKCDAATTNTWPCSACIRLKLHCVRPNGYDGATEPQVYEPPRPQFEPSHIQDGFRQQLPLHDQQLLASAQKPQQPSLSQAAMFHQQPSASSYADTSSLPYLGHYGESQTAPQNVHYTTVPPSAAVNVMDQPYAHQHQAFPASPLQQAPRPGDSPADSYSEEQYGQLSDLLGSLKVNEAGTGEFKPGE